MDDRVLVTELFRLAKLGSATKFLEFTETNYGNSDSWGFVRQHKSGNTVAYVAAECGHVSILSLCRDVHLELANRDGKRPLHIAAQVGHVGCVVYLLSRHVDVDCFKRADWTPLMLACTKGNLEVIRKLADAGANMGLVNKDGWNCFHIAAREGHEEIISYLLVKEPAIWLTVSRNGRTPLHTAALHGKLGVVRTLVVRCGAEPDSTDSCGTTPLMDALRAGHVDTGRLLLEYGADLYSRDNVGRQSLHLAVQANSRSSVEFLVVERNADVNERTTTTGDTCLHIAAKEGHVDMIALLLSLKADGTLRNIKSRTAMEVAEAVGRVECVRLLSSTNDSDVLGR